MKTSHINHVVLYAKNFYRHTDDVVKDMQRFMQLDGHRYKKIDTPEKVWKAMRRDYLEWANSLNDELHGKTKQSFIDEVDDNVMWANGEVSHIWSVLIKYGIFIPMTSTILGHPVYDKYHMPQFNINENLFDRTKSFDDWNKAAAEFLDSTQEERLDDYMNRLMDKYHFEELSQVFHENGDTEVNAKSLEDELWNLYTEFMNENVLEGGKLKAGYFNPESEHFCLSIDTHDYRVFIDATALFGGATFTVPGKFEDNIIKIFKIASEDEMLIDGFIHTNHAINKAFAKVDEDYRYTLDEDDLDYDKVQDTMARMYQEFTSGYFHNKLMQEKETGFETWRFAFNIKIKEDSVELSIQHRDIWEHSTMEDSLRSTSCIIDGRKN